MKTDDIDYTKDFDVIVRKYYNEIFHYVHKQTSNIEESKDLTQEIFMKVYNNLSKYNKDKATFRTWLYRIAHNHVLNHFKSLSYRNSLKNIKIEADIVISKDDFLQYLIQKEEVKEVITIMNKILSKKHLKIINLYFFSELGVTEISETLEIPKKTVSNVISLSIKKIRNELEGYVNG